MNIQEFQFQCESSIINSNLKFVVELLEAFTNEEDGGLSSLLGSSSQAFEDSKKFRREEVCEYLDASKSLVERSGEDIHAKKMFIELIHLDAIKAIITFKLEKQAVELDVSDPGRGFGMFNLLYTLLSNVASISRSPLNFNALILIDVF